MLEISVTGPARRGRKIIVMWRLYRRVLRRLIRGVVFRGALFARSAFNEGGRLTWPISVHRKSKGGRAVTPAGSSIDLSHADLSNPNPPR